MHMVNPTTSSPVLNISDVRSQTDPTFVKSKILLVILIVLEQISKLPTDLVYELSRNHSFWYIVGEIDGRYEMANLLEPTLESLIVPKVALIPSRTYYTTSMYIFTKIRKLSLQEHKMLQHEASKHASNNPFHEDCNSQNEPNFYYTAIEKLEKDRNDYRDKYMELI